MNNYNKDLIIRLKDNLENFMVKDLDVIENEIRISILTEKSYKYIEYCTKKSYMYIEQCVENVLEEKSKEINEKAKTKTPTIFKMSNIEKNILIEYVDNYIKTYLLLELNIYCESGKKRDYAKILNQNFINELLNYEILLKSNIRNLLESEKTEIAQLMDKIVKENDISKKDDLINILAGVNEQLDTQNIVNYVFQCIESDNSLHNVILDNIQKNNTKLKSEINEDQINEITEITKQIPILKARKIYINDLILELTKKKNLRLAISNYKYKVDFLNKILIEYMIKITWKKLNNIRAEIIPEEFINEITMGGIFLDDIDDVNNLSVKEDYIKKEPKINKNYKDRFELSKLRVSNNITNLLTNLMKYDCENTELIRIIARNVCEYNNIEKDVKCEIVEYVEENIIKTLLYSNAQAIAIHGIIEKFSYNGGDENSEYIKLWDFISNLDFYDQGSKSILKCFKLAEGNINKVNIYTVNDIKYLYDFRNNEGITKKLLKNRDKFYEFICGFTKNINKIGIDYVFKYKIQDLERFYAFDLLLGICRHIDKNQIDDILISKLYSMPLLQYRQRIIEEYDYCKRDDIIQEIENINSIINQVMFDTINLLMLLNKCMPLLKDSELINTYTCSNKSREEILKESFKNVSYIRKLEKTHFTYVSNMFFDTIDRFGIKIKKNK